MACLIEVFQNHILLPALEENADDRRIETVLLDAARAGRRRRQ